MHQSDFDELVERFDDPARQEWQRIPEVIELLGGLSGETVADIGAGTGYFAFPMAEKANQVIAIDIDQRFLDLIDKRAAERTVTNVHTRLVSEDNPQLAAEEVNTAIIVNTYHHIHDREAYFAKVKAGLKSGGRLVVIDFALKETPHGPPVEMRIGPDVVSKELTAAGFSIDRVEEELLPYQYILIATRQ